MKWLENTVLFTQSTCYLAFDILYQARKWLTIAVAPEFMNVDCLSIHGGINFLARYRMVSGTMQTRKTSIVTCVAMRDRHQGRRMMSG